MAISNNSGLNRNQQNNPAEVIGRTDLSQTRFGQSIDQLQKKLTDLGKGGVLDPDTLKASTKELQSQIQLYQNIGSRFQALQANRSAFADQPQQLAQVNREQARLLSTLEKQSKIHSDIAKFQQQRFDLEKQARQSSPQYSAHSSRQFSQLSALALRDISRPAGDLYRNSISGYQQTNSRFNIDPGLTNSNNNLNRSRLELGQNLSGYQQAKQNALAAFNRSNLAAPVAIGGDIAGLASGAAGTLLPLAQLAKLGGGGESLLGKLPGGSTLGKLGGGATLLGGVLSKLLEGKEIVEQTGPLLQLGKTVEADVKAGKISESEAKKYMAAKQGERTTGVPFGSEISGFFSGLGAGGFLDPKRKAELDKQYGVGKAGTADQPALNLGQKVQQSQEWQLTAQGFRNQIKDFQVSLAHETRDINRGYTRNTQDISRSRGRTIQDYGIEQSRFGLQGQYLQQDYGRTVGRASEDHTRELSRINFDFNKNRTRNEEDFAHAVEANQLQVYRVTRDTQISLSRNDEDYSRNRVRLEADSTRDISRLREDSVRELSRLESDSARDSQRLEADSAKAQSRLTEDTNRDRLRSNQDYARNSMELTRQSSRSQADLKTGFQDNLIGILAPGLASSKAFQVMKLSRDYQKQSGRLGEDTQFARQGLDLNKSRADEDITRNLARGTADIATGLNRGREDIGQNLARGREDINRNLGRGEADIAQNKARGEEDLAREHSRASMDALRQETDALKDAQINLRNETTTYNRNLIDNNEIARRGIEDSNTQFGRTLTDAATQFTRDTEQLNFEMSQSSLNFKRSLDDLDITQKRVNEDLKTSLSDIQDAKDKFSRDMNLSLDSLVPGLSQMGLNMTEINNLLGSFKQKIADIDGLQLTAGADLGVQAGAKGYKHALGLYSVPYDEYPAQLHRGEMILTAQGANQYRNYLGGTVNGIPGLGAGQSTMDIGGDPTNFLAKAGDNGLTMGLGGFGVNGSNWDVSRRLAAGRNQGGAYIPPAGHQFTFNMPVTVQASGQSEQKVVQKNLAQFKASTQRDLLSLY